MTGPGAEYRQAVAIAVPCGANEANASSAGHWAARAMALLHCRVRQSLISSGSSFAGTTSLPMAEGEEPLITKSQYTGTNAKVVNGTL